MGDEARFSEKWDFRRKENSFDDSSNDDPDTNPNHDPTIHNPNLVHHTNQIDDGTRAVAKKQPLKTRKRRSKKDETKPEKPKQRRGRKPKTVCVEENTKKDETIMDDGVGTFMKTLVDDLTASRESLMDWMKTELYGSSNQNVPSRPPVTKRAVGTVAAQKPVKRRRTKKQIEEEKIKKEEEEKKKGEESKPGNTGKEMNTTKEKNLVITQLDGDLHCNAGTLEMFLKSGQSDLGRNYFQQQDQEALVAQTEMENLKNETVKSQKSIVLAIQAPNLSKKQKKESVTNTYKNKSSMVESIRPETQKDHYAVTPYVPQQYSSSSLQSYPVPSSIYPNPPSSSLLQSFSVPSPLYSSPSQGISSLTGNTNFQMRQPVVAQIPNNSEFQTGVTERQEFGNPICDNNGYLSGFPPAFQPNLIAGGYNFPAQVNPASSLQQRDNNNMFGGLTMAGGAIRYSGNRFPEAELRNGYNCPSDYRASSGR